MLLLNPQLDPTAGAKLSNSAVHSVRVRLPLFRCVCVVRPPLTAACASSYRSALAVAVVSLSASASASATERPSRVDADDVDVVRYRHRAREAPGRFALAWGVGTPRCFVQGVLPRQSARAVAAAAAAARARSVRGLLRPEEGNG